jgi:hypothetical protein
VLVGAAVGVAAAGKDVAVGVAVGVVVGVDVGDGVAVDVAEGAGSGVAVGGGVGVCAWAVGVLVLRGAMVGWAAQAAQTSEMISRMLVRFSRLLIAILDGDTQQLLLGPNRRWP